MWRCVVSVAKRLGKVASFSVSPEGLGWRGQDGGDDGISAFMEMARARDETEEWKGAPPVPSLFVPEKLQSRLISASKSSTIHAIGRNP